MSTPNLSKSQSDGLDWQLQVLRPEAQRLLQILGKLPALEGFYLAGGTALALQLGHRESIDFDFFTGDDFKAASINPFTQLSQYKPLSIEDNYAEFFVDGVKVMLMSYFYPTSGKFKLLQGINIASPVDIGIMKITALEGRMSWKDIIDLYFLDQQVIKLEDLAAEYLIRFPQEKLNSYAQLKILFDIDEINTTPKPKMLKEVDFDLALEVVTQKLLQAFGSQFKLV